MLSLTKYHSPDVTGALHRVPVGEVALGVDVDQTHRVGAQRLSALAILGETAAIYCILLLLALRAVNEGSRSFHSACILQRL